MYWQEIEKEINNSDIKDARYWNLLKRLMGRNSFKCVQGITTSRGIVTQK
jgi:hypothetical protein